MRPSVRGAPSASSVLLPLDALRYGATHCPWMPKRKRLAFVCVNRRPDGTPKGSCAVRGSVDLHAKLKALLKERGMWTTEVRACTSSCLDTCWVGPSIAVEPDHYFYGRVAEEDLDEIVEAWARDERVERLVLSAEDFLEPKSLRGR